MTQPPPRTTEALTETTPTHVLVRECRLTVLDGPLAGEAHTFGAPRIVIGADPSADLTLDDPTLSKFHCELRITERGAFVRDLGSRNGTAIDRVEILDAPLRPGAVLTLGRTQLGFDVGARQIRVPLSPRTQFGRLRGASVPMRAVYAKLEAAAAVPTTVLLLGESGTGKELAAEALHLEGPRRDGPFVVVDAGAIAPTLLESELFGHEAGAFTGAAARRVGAFEAAHGGTLFLDEIGELALELQPKLLRAIEQRAIQRVGSTERIPVDLRLIAATNRDLHAEVNAHRFRSDLYFRLAVLEVTLPPLRERTSDIPALVEAMLDGLGDRTSPMAQALAGGELASQLQRHAWPGNVRELRNYVEASLARQEVAWSPLDAPEPTIDVGLPLRAARDRWVRHAERRYLALILAAHGDNVSAAARAAGIDRVHMHRLLVRAGLR